MGAVGGKESQSSQTNQNMSGFGAGRYGIQGCQHINSLSKAKFRALVRGKFLGEVNGRIPKDIQTPPKVTEDSPASILANAGAPKTGKDEVIRTQTILHCQVCAAEGDGKAETAKKYVNELIAQSRIGAVCNLDTWFCMDCGLMACLSPDKGDTEAKRPSRRHVLDHYAKTKHTLWIQCHDSHVFCIACQSYVYPRELSGNSRAERFLDDIVYQWLLTLGRVRIWWRILDRNQPILPKTTKKTAPARGIENFGNTCFFTSTCQALMHCSKLQSVLSASPNPPPIQRELSNLWSIYWDTNNNSNTNHINPRRFFQTVRRNALFGNYGDHTMEDSNSLIMDVLTGLDQKLVDETFGIKLQSKITCQRCASNKAQVAQLLSKALGMGGEGQESATRPVDTIMQCIYSSESSARNLPAETVLSLGLVDPMDEFKRSQAQAQQSGVDRLVSLMTIHAQADTDPAVKLEDLIRRYFTKEHISDYRCSTCQQKGGCYKEITSKTLPSILILQLKRFAPTLTGVQIKCHKKVIVPETLNLEPFRLPESEPKPAKAYKLSSMVVHDGGMGGGHNMCYAKLPEGEAEEEEKDGGKTPDKWMWFSDRHIGPVSEAEVAAAEPYILLYELK